MDVLESQTIQHVRHDFVRSRIGSQRSGWLTSGAETHNVLLQTVLSNLHLLRHRLDRLQVKNVLWRRRRQQGALVMRSRNLYTK